MFQWDTSTLQTIYVPVRYKHTPVQLLFQWDKAHASTISIQWDTGTLQYNLCASGIQTLQYNLCVQWDTDTLPGEIQPNPNPNLTPKPNLT
jgi:hypothetical protein